MNKDNIKFHLVGIKGTGMSALAQTLKEMGYDVIGSDTNESYFTDAILKNKSIKVLNFNKDNIDGSRFYIISLAYDNSLDEVDKIIKNDFEYMYYNQFIENFFQGIKIGISGSHGKTSTTSFINDFFQFDKKCSIIGDGTGFGVKDYKFMIFEACEYRKHLLTYSYDYLVITSIDKEHLDCYKDIFEIEEVFKKASKKTKNLIIHESLKIRNNHLYTYGKGDNNFCYYKIKKANGNGYILDIYINKILISDCEFRFYGEHMINDLLASLVVYYLTHSSIDIDLIRSIINNLKKPKRRMEEYKVGSNIIIDDYAHHPTEIKALFESIKQKYPTKSVIVVFQPHTYSRTESLQKEFVDCFKEVSKLYLYETFPSKREKYDFQKELNIKNIFKNSIEFNFNVLNELKVVEESVIVFLGAGVVNKYIKYLIL